LKVKDELAGKKVKCPQCGQVVVAPAVVTSGKTPPGISTSGTVAVAPGDEAKTLPPRRPDPLTSALTLPPGEPSSADAGGDNARFETAGDLPGSRAEDPQVEWTSFLAPARGAGELGWLGPYRVLEVLGAGGMGVVYRAEDPHLQRPVALKALLPALVPSPTARQRFLREARAAAAIKHNHIVTIYQVGEDRGVPFLAMEFLEGEPLDKRLMREGSLAVAEVLRIGREIAEGLAAAHDRGLIHRDIKPANVWLEGAGAWVKILDFGLARAARDDQHLTQQGAVVGTPAYMAPEQAGGQAVDRRSDLFSLGCVLYRLSTGELPFKGSDTMATLMALATVTPPSPQKINPRVPQRLADLVMALLAKNPEERPASAQAVVDTLRAIEQAQGQAPLVPAPAPKRMLATRPGKTPWVRSRLWLAVAAGLLAAVAIGTFLLLNRGNVPVVQEEAKEEGTKKKAKKDQTPPDPKAQPGGPCAADALRRDDIPAEKLAWAGAGNPANAPRELVAVLKDPYMAGDFSPDGKTLALGTREGQVKLRDVATRKEQTLAGKHRFNIFSLRFAPDGKRVGTSSADGTVKLWDVATAKEERTVASMGFNNFPRIGFSPDGQTLAVGGVPSNPNDGEKLQLYSVTGAVPAVTLAEPCRAELLVFSPAGNRLITASPVKVWDTAAGKEHRTLANLGSPKGLDVSRDGNTLACRYAAVFDVQLHDAETGEPGKILREETEIFQAVFSPDGKKVAVVSRGHIRVWESATAKVEQTINIARAPLGDKRVIFSPEGRHLVTFNSDGTVCIFRLRGVP
jgi:serine/threonine protein kinase